MRLVEIPAGEQVDAVGIARSHVVGLAEHVVVPVDHAAVRHRALGAHGHGRAVGLPLELVVAHPLQPDRAAVGGARQQRRVERHVVRAIVAIAAGALGVDAADRGGRHAERPRHGGAQRKHALAVGPDRELAVLELGQRAGWRNRPVRLVGPMIGGLDHLGAPGQRRLLLADNLDLARQRDELLIEARRIGQFGTGLPFRRGRERGARLDRLLFALGNHAEEAAVAHHRDHALHRLHRGLVKAFELCAIARRAHYAAVQHAGEADVLYERAPAGHLGRDVQPCHRLADDLVLCRRLWRDLGGRFALEVHLAREFAIADLAAVACADYAVTDAERIGGDAEFLGRQLKQDRAHLGAGQAQRGAAVLDRLAARGLALVRGAAGVAGHHGHPSERHVEFFRRDLGERGDDALAELDLAGEHRNGAVGIDAQPSIQHAVAAQAARQRGRLLAARKLWTEAEGEHDAAKTGGEIAATELGSVHGQILPFACAARSTARMLRG